NGFNRMAATLQTTQTRRRALMADLAHELRTPLATLDSFLEGIQDGVIPASDTTWQTMAEQTSRLRRLVDDIDAVSRAEERTLQIQRELVDANDTAAAAMAAASAAYADKGIALHQHHSPSPAPVAADPDRLREILDNLLSNALRHTPPGGDVSVACAAGAGAVEISVTDTGEGIAAEHLPHLFDRFYRADPARSRATGGSGIG